MTILLAGLAAAVVIYARAVAAPDLPAEFSPDYSKKVLRDLQTYGGDANVLGYQLTRWFASLWHGRRLAVTVVVLAALAAGGYLFFAAPLPDPGDGPPDRRRAG